MVVFIRVYLVNTFHMLQKVYSLVLIFIYEYIKLKTS